MGTLLTRAALVTGGTRGIGGAIARRLVADGFRVTVTGRAGADRGPDGCSYRSIDFSDRAASQAFADDLADWNLDALVNNVGINEIASFESINVDDFDRILEVNLRSAFLCCRAVVPGMRRRKWGRIVNIASIFSVVSKECRGAYSASKFGLDGMTAALAAEVAADGVLVNCVSPGFTKTDLTQSVLGDKGMQEVAERIPAKRLAQPDEIAALVAWMVSDQNSYISGQNIVIDGGFSRV